LSNQFGWAMIKVNMPLSNSLSDYSRPQGGFELLGMDKIFFAVKNLYDSSNLFNIQKTPLV